MSKTVSIPTCMDPFIVMVNGVKYSFPAGQTVDVPDEVALVIERHHASHKKKPEGTAAPYGGGVSSWNDLTDKPFDTEIVVILPETTLTNESEDTATALAAYPIEVGKEYTVKYNGVEYVVSNGVEVEGIVCFGNLSAFDESFSDTGEPFFACGLQDEGLYMVLVGSLDGSTEFTVSITNEKVTPIEQKYVTNVLPYWIVVEDHPNEDAPGATDRVYTTKATVTEVEAAIKSGKDIKMRIDMYSNTALLLGQTFAHLCGRDLLYSDPTKWYLSFYYSNLTQTVFSFYAIPQDDGTYKISSNIDLG